MSKIVCFSLDSQEHSAQFNSSLTIIATKYGISQTELKERYDKYWSRWHELIDIESARPLTQEENAEYSRMKKVAKRLDTREAAEQERHLKPILKEHGRRIASLKQATNLLEQLLEEE